MTNLTRDLASKAADAIRELNHLTYGPGDLPLPAAYTVIAELDTLAYRLAQLLDQLAANLAARQTQGGLRLDAIGSDHYTTTEQAVERGQAALLEAAVAARSLGQVLDEAHNITATIADHGPTKERS